LLAEHGLPPQIFGYDAPVLDDEPRQIEHNGLDHDDGDDR
jgi:hypothetical protein